MKIDDTLNSIRDRIRPPRDGKLGNLIKVAAGTAAAVWVVLQLRRELYERRRWGSQSDGAPLRTPMSTLATF